MAKKGKTGKASKGALTGRKKPINGSSSTSPLYTDFDSGAIGTMDNNVANFRQAITDLRISLFRQYGIDHDNWKTVIRMQPTTSTKSADCGCGCS